MLNAESQARITQLRAKVADGSITLDEQREAVRLLREGRLAASQASDASRRTKAKAEIPSADELLGQLTSL